MSKSPLAIAVVGHTNVGKTSLLRTLLRDSRFGEVSSNPSTTQHVAMATLRTATGQQLNLYDTPGLEDGISLYDYLSQFHDATARHDGPKQMQMFLESPEASHNFEQEAKVIRQLLKSDAAFYVIDVRDPVLPKFQDELSILTRCGRPLLPVLNFTASMPNQSEAWRESLAHVNLHAWVEFDSVAPPQGGEDTIFRRLQALLPSHQELLQNFLDDNARARKEQQQSAARLIAELLIDCAAYRKTVHGNDAELLKESVSDLQEKVRQREQTCVQALLRLFNFRPDDATFGQLAIADGRWEHDLFHPHALRQFGVRASKGAAAGAAAGAGVDLLLAGTTLGAGTAIGAALGGMWQGWRGYGDRLRDQIRGYRTLTVDDSILRLLAVRQQHLVRLLSQRGHAATEAVQVELNEDSNWQQHYLSEVLEQCRANPQWSALNVTTYTESQERQRALESVVKHLL